MKTTKGNTLHDLLTEANKLFDRYEAKLRTGILIARDLGGVLSKMQKKFNNLVKLDGNFKDCNWTDWLKDNFKCKSYETVRHYIRVHKGWSKIVKRYGENPAITIDLAIKHLKWGDQDKEFKDAELEQMAAESKSGTPLGPFYNGVNVARRALVNQIKEKLLQEWTLAELVFLKRQQECGDFDLNKHMDSVRNEISPIAELWFRAEVQSDPKDSDKSQSELRTLKIKLYREMIAVIKSQETLTEYQREKLTQFRKTLKELKRDRVRSESKSDENESRANRARVALGKLRAKRDNTPSQVA